MIRATLYFALIAVATAHGLGTADAKPVMPPAIRTHSGESISLHQGQFKTNPERSPSFSTGERALIYYEGFESGAPAWELHGCFEVGHPTSGPQSGSNSPACAATVLDGNYPENLDDPIYAHCWAATPEIALPASSPAQLSFWEWYSIEPQPDPGQFYDFAAVVLSTDSGASWGTVSNWRAGDQMSWRQVNIDLSAFAGQTVVIGFALWADDTISYPGWYVDDVEVTVENGGGGETLDVACVDVDASEFPLISVEVDVERNGVDVPGLSASNFMVNENGLRQTDSFELIPPNSGGSRRPVDIVFCMDNSVSMQNEIQSVRENVASFFANLENSGADAAFGLVRFGVIRPRNNECDLANNVIVENGGQLTTDIDYFRNEIWTRNIHNGGRIEPSWDAIVRGSTSFAFRPDARTIFVLITDEEVTGSNNPGQGGSNLCSVTRDNVLASLDDKHITLYSFVDRTDTTSDYDYCQLADMTQGRCFDIESDFDQLFDAIVEDVSGTYIVRYRSGNPAADGTPRQVSVEATSANDTGSCSIGYNAPDEPQSVPALFFDPDPAALQRGHTVMVDLRIADADNVLGVQAQIRYDSARVQVQAIHDGEFLSRNGASITDLSFYNNSIGTATVQMTASGGSPEGISGNGVVASIQFIGVAEEPDSELHFETASIRDPHNQHTSPLTDDGLIDGDSSCVLLGDLNADEAVGFDDFTALVWCWNQDPDDLRCDLAGPVSGPPPPPAPWCANSYPYPGDGVIDFEDLAVFTIMYNWSQGSARRNAQGVASTAAATRIADVQPVAVTTSAQRRGDNQVGVQITIGSTDEIVGLHANVDFNQELLRFDEARVALASAPPDVRIAGLDVVGGSGVEVNRGFLGAAYSTGETVTVELLFSFLEAGEHSVAFTLSDLEIRSSANSPIPIDVPDGATKITLQSLTPTGTARARLLANVPNPFNPSTSIGYEVAVRGPVTLRVFGADGRLVRTLVDQLHASGTYEVTWDGTDYSGRFVATGPYFYRLTAQGYVETRRMLLLK